MPDLNGGHVKTTPVEGKWPNPKPTVSNGKHENYAKESVNGWPGEKEWNGGKWRIDGGDGKQQVNM